MNSPCAKLTIRITPNTSARPIATSPSNAPKTSPLIASWSVSVIGLFPRRFRPDRLRGIRYDSRVAVLPLGQRIAIALLLQFVIELVRSEHGPHRGRFDVIADPVLVGTLRFERCLEDLSGRIPRG